MKSIRIGHSPDPDDAFMFYGFASEQVTIPDHKIEHVLHDIQTLNEMAMGRDPLEVTALSVHGFLHVQDRYELLEVGTSVGRNYGPRLIARECKSLEDLRGMRVALPGPYTTATLVARKMIPDMREVHMDFTHIMDAVRKGSVEAGVIIHEGQLTYADEGFKLLPGDSGRPVACFAAPREIYKDIPAALRWGDFQDLKAVEGFGDIQKLLETVAKEPVASANAVLK